MRYSITCALLAVLIGARCGLAAENNSNEASGFAEGGAALLATGKTDKAQTLFYKALAYDSRCAVALYELGKLFETEGNMTAAADFLARANLELAKGEAAHPDYAAKHRDATQRLQKLNPYALQYNQLMESYALDLCKITKKSPDSLTAEEVCTRIDTLNLAMILPKDKLPNVYCSELNLGGGVKLELVFVKAGEFAMGSSDGDANEKPVHKVKISKPFNIGKYDVMVAQFQAFANATKYQTEAEKQHRGNTVRDGRWQMVLGANWRNPGFKQGDNHPAVIVSWNDAQEFCKWATKATGRTVRLPTEAEWEYAARGPSSPKYPWGDKWEGIIANVADASLSRTGFNIKRSEINEDDGYPFTSPCGAYKNASWCGAYDMAGNVWQWVEDRFDGDYYAGSPAVDPQGPANGGDRVIRGGGWDEGPDGCRSAHRIYNPPGRLDADNGFRVVVVCGLSRTP